MRKHTVPIRKSKTRLRHELICGMFYRNVLTRKCSILEPNTFCIPYTRNVYLAKKEKKIVVALE